PARGYYRSRVARPGRAGDYLTAPEAHPIFGRAIAPFARAVHDAIGSPEPLTIREFGAGEGALAEPLVTALASRRIRYLVAEVEPARVESVRARLLATHSDIEVVADDGRAIDGLAIANEVLDALPTHRVVQRRDRLREILVGLAADGEELIDAEGDPSTPALADRLHDEAVGDGRRPGPARDEDPVRVPRRARAREPARRRADRARRDAPGLPRGSVRGRPHDRPGGDGRVPGHGVRPRSAAGDNARRVARTGRRRRLLTDGPRPAARRVARAARGACAASGSEGLVGVG